MSTVVFSKMHGLGNDFVIINVHDLPVALKELPIAKLSNRNLGIGFDQLLLITPKQQVEEFFCQIFNADGSEAEQCGNGLRCVARYVQESGLCEAPNLVISTIAGSYPVKVEDYDHITVTMGIPKQSTKNFELETKHFKQPIKVYKLDIGNPHAIVNVGLVPAEVAAEIAAEIAASPHFPAGVNIGFVGVLNKNQMRLRTFERGAGETFACGSNASAAAIIGITEGWVNSPVQIEFKYGVLKVEWEGANQPVQLTGPASQVFRGELIL